MWSSSPAAREGSETEDEESDAGSEIEQPDQDTAPQNRVFNMFLHPDVSSIISMFVINIELINRSLEIMFAEIYLCNIHKNTHALWHCSHLNLAPTNRGNQQHVHT